MKEPSEAAFELAQPICVLAARLASIADVLCRQHPSRPEGLRGPEYTALVHECVAFLMHYCDFVFFAMGPGTRARAVSRIAEAVNEIMSNADLWKYSKFIASEQVAPRITLVRGFDCELANTRNLEYARLTKPNGDFSESIEAFADHVVRLVPAPVSKDMRTLATSQSIEYLRILDEMITADLAAALAS